MATALISTKDFLQHDSGEHPECPARYAAIIKGIQADHDLGEELLTLAPVAATDEDILRCHDLQTISAVESACEASNNSHVRLDADTVVSRQSEIVARLAAGGACLAVDKIMQGAAENAFVACRPPGHHATIDHSMGFCLFNNVAIAARYAQAKYPEIKKVLIVDFDVHHGNGTQDIFYADDSVFYYSLHQYPWYPGTGAAQEIGQQQGEGFTLNIPLAQRTPAKEYLRQFELGLEQIVKKFAADLVIISAGFDAHREDPLGQLMLQDEDYQTMTKSLKGLATSSANGRLVSCLEGGYNLRTLGATVKTHVEALMR